jgi:predicted transposase/invertase (TIGR01784 family)
MKTDKAWKEVIEELFEDFVKFFMPDLYEIIDFSKGYEFLDKEFNTLFPESETEDKRLDKLIKTFLKDGQEQWILIHTEIQSYSDKNFEKRMYQYYARIFDKYDKDIEAIAIFTFSGETNKSYKYEKKFLKTKLTYEYRTYDISKQTENDLKLIKNPFSLVTIAALKAITHIDNDENNVKFKRELLKLLFQSGYTKKESESIFRFLNFIYEIKDPIIKKEFYQEVNEMALKDRLDVLTDYDEVVAEIARKDEKIKTAKNMKNEGYTTEQISKITALTKEEIEKIN